MVIPGGMKKILVVFFRSYFSNKTFLGVEKNEKGSNCFLKLMHKRSEERRVGKECW